MDWQKRWHYLQKNYQEDEEQFIKESSAIIAENCQQIASLIKESYLQEENILRRYLLLKAVGRSKCLQLMPFLEEVVLQEKRKRLQQEALQAMLQINPLRAYLIFLRIKKLSSSDLAQRIDFLVNELLKNKLVFYFDFFYQQRVKSEAEMNVAVDFLKQNMAPEFLPELLFLLNGTNFFLISYLLRLLAARPLNIATMVIFRFISNNYRSISRELFIQAVDSFVACAEKCEFLEKYPAKIEALLKKMPREEFICFQLQLLKVGYLMPRLDLKKFYSALNSDQKIKFLKNSSLSVIKYVIKEIEQDFQQESDEQFLQLAAQKILEVGKKDSLHSFFIQLNDLNQKRAALAALLEKPAEDDIALLEKHFHYQQPVAILEVYIDETVKQGITSFIKPMQRVWCEIDGEQKLQLIIRRFNKLKSPHLEEFIRVIFADRRKLARLTDELLIALIPLFQKETGLPLELQEIVLNQILVLMEEADFEQLINFIHFFDAVVISAESLRLLIVEELRLIQNTILKSRGNDDLIGRLHFLINKIGGKKV